MSENNTTSENSPVQDTKTHTVKSKQNIRSEAKRVSPIITGVFWVIVGIMMLLVNFFDSTSISLVAFVHTWGMLMAGIYLLLFSILGYMRKIYFIFGICAIALWLGNAIEVSENLSVKVTWPIIMIVVSVSIIVYGFIFKKHKLKNYFITGCIFLIFSLLVLISVLYAFDLSQLLKKGWPVFLIFLGISYMYNKNRILKTKKTSKKPPEVSEEK